jgi:hypothetical protein
MGTQNRSKIMRMRGRGTEETYENSRNNRNREEEMKEMNSRRKKMKTLIRGGGTR